MNEEVEKLKAGLELIWALDRREKVHLGLERQSGVEQGCISCICALTLDRGMGEVTTELLKARLTEIDTE